MAVNLFTNGAGGNTWGTAGNWSQGTIPTASDGHVTTFDGTSPNCTMGAARSCNNIDFTGYTNTLTMSTSILTVAGNVTLDTGMLISGTGQMAISATSTITSNGYSWPNNMEFSGNGTTKTISGDLTILGTFLLRFNQSNVINKTTSEKIYSNGITVPSGGTPTGTIEIILTGGTWTGTASVGVDLTFQGNVSFSGSIGFTGTAKTLKYVSGTITQNSIPLQLTGNGSTLSLDTSGVVWYSIQFSGVTVTLLSTLYATSASTAASPTSMTFAGSFGWEFGSFTHGGTSASTVSLKESITYTITTLLSAYLSRTGSVVLFTSSHASTKANLVLVNGATCRCLCNFTRIDASGGRPIRSFNGVLTSTENIVSINDLATVGSSF